MGSHTDYNLGYVLTLPISRDTWIAARPRTDGVVRIYAANLDDEASFQLDSIEFDEERPWSNYVRAVAAVLAGEGLELNGFDGVLESTVPIGSGLSSSAALECAVATLFQALSSWRLDAAVLARLCQRAENEFVGVNCGILDQFSSSLGHAGCALLLDCRDLSYSSVPFAEGLRVMICDTRAPRQLAGSEYGERRAQCEFGARSIGVAALRDATLADLDRAAVPEPAARRCRFIIEENARVLALADALSRGDRAAIGRLTAESFAGARDLYEICAPSMLHMMGGHAGRTRHRRRAPGRRRLRRLHGGLC